MVWREALDDTRDDNDRLATDSGVLITPLVGDSSI
ncbi:hypothetical protein BJY16_001628 [Actinoplanes octamycinicus]|uniref:Uncharacterized protein n=1 Tax=Actinoplanes octamycinicus TaxID=135948 RepID=A0A7W7M5W8_9ACTN|nr:hypothetical protein [Actinoplanes octamycinicus]